MEASFNIPNSVAVFATGNRKVAHRASLLIFTSNTVFHIKRERERVRESK